MRNRRVNSIKLGFFVLLGMALLIGTLYTIGKKRGFFSRSFELKAQFSAVNGLVSGNNVRYSGIDIGAVKSVVFTSDTVIEVTMNVQSKMQQIIRKNAVVSLGTDGLIGNRVVNIMPARGAAPLVQSGDLLPSKEEISADAMLQTLYKTNENIAAVSEELKITIHRISTSAQLTQLLDDRSLGANLKASLIHLHETTEKASSFLTEASQTLSLASEGSGTLATLLTDTTLATEIETVVQKIRTLETGAERLTTDLNRVVESVDQDLNRGKGPVNAMLKDSLMTENLRNTLINLEKSTATFNQNMEALRHNFLFRKYFRKMEKQKKQ